jgi:ABC-type Na+ transport system ATPase subunit NatA
MADRIVVLSGGNVVLDGKPAELRRATGLDNLEEIFMAATAGDFIPVRALTAVE